jgi:hypothetical protein
VLSQNAVEVQFSCYCRPETLIPPVRIGLHHANIDVVDVYDGKPSAADRHIFSALNRFERVCKPPSMIVLISSDIDFVQRLSDLRYAGGYQIVVIHNDNVRPELRGVAHASYVWKQILA